MRYPTFRIHVASLFLLVVLLSAAKAAEVVRYVPADALGFIVIKDLSAMDGKVAQLLKTLNVELPAPLSFLQSATGISDGLDPHGELMLSLLSRDEPEGKHQICVWLPVRDFDRLITSLGATPRKGIIPVSVAGEDLLVAHHDKWALIMDPEQRAGMEQILASGPNQPPILERWSAWIDSHDVTLVAMQGCIRHILLWANDGRELGAAPKDDLFGQAAGDEDPIVAAPTNQLTGAGLDAKVGSIRKWINESPAFANWLMGNMRTTGCGLRLDDKGNVLAELRMHFSDARLVAEHRAVSKELPPAIYPGGEFVLQGAGGWSPPLARIATELLARSAFADLKTEHRWPIVMGSATRFAEALRSVLTEITSLAVLTHPGEKSEGIYTNEFIVADVASSESFVESASEVMRLWNKLNRDAKGENPLIFDVEEQKFGDRTATLYSLDVAGDEAMAIPEVRQSMEKFFGPGGKLRLWIVPVDEDTVLLAAGTPLEVAAALEFLDRKQPINWGHAELSAAHSLLPEQSDWRLFVSPHAYSRWHRMFRDAMTGPTFGGRAKKEFPASPPIGFAAGLRDDELWLNAAVPAETIQATGSYLKKK